MEYREGVREMTLKTLIKEMIAIAEKTNNYDLAELIQSIILTFSSTFNAPSNWRDIGEKLAVEYDIDSWAFNNLELWEYLDDDENEDD